MPIFHVIDVANMKLLNYSCINEKKNNKKNEKKKEFIILADSKDCSKQFCGFCVMFNYFGSNHKHDKMNEKQHNRQA